MRITPISIKNNFINQKRINNNFEKDARLHSHNNSFSFSGVQTITNISFGVRPAPPVYLIDKDLNCILYQKQSELAEKFDVSPQRINACLNGRNPSVEGNVIVYKHQIEKKLDDGTVAIDKKKVAEIYTQRTQPKAVYTMDYLGNIKKYDSSSKIEASKGLFVISASEVESFDDDGQLILNKKKIAEGLLRSSCYFAVYSRDANGVLKKYENQSAFAQEKGVSKTSVNAVISGRMKTICGYNIIPSVLVETVSDEGEIIVNKQKMIDYLSQNTRFEKVFYTVSPNLEYKRYDSRKDLAEQNGMNYSSMLKTTRNVTPNGDFIIEASEIEEYDDKFQLFVNKSKLAKIVAECLSSEAIYTIDMDMNIEKYDNLDSAAIALDRKPATLRMTLWKPELHKSVSDKVVVRASEIEIIDEDGNVSVDKNKVSKLVQSRLFKNAVYLIDDKGQCKKFRNRYAVTKYYGTSASSSQNVRINGFLIVDANLIEEINEDGTISLNQDKVSEYAKKSKASF